MRSRVTKTELRASYEDVRARYVRGDFLTNEYALHLDRLLSGYFGVPELTEEEVAEG